MRISLTQGSKGHPLIAYAVRKVAAESLYSFNRLSPDQDFFKVNK